MIFFKNPLKFKLLSFIKGNGYFTATPKADSLKPPNLSCNLFFYFCCGYSTNPLIIKQKSLFVEQQFFKNVFEKKKLQGNVYAFSGPLVVDIAKKQNKKREKKRSARILPQHIGRVFFVHNGKTFSSIHIYRKMLGHKFGEFASTRKKPLHKKKR